MEIQRIGVHLGTAGGCWTAVQRAVDAGANTFQIFSSSPRTWRAAAVKPEDAEKMRTLRAEHDVSPLVIHASYLINLCSQTESVRANAVSGVSRRGGAGAGMGGGIPGAAPRELEGADAGRGAAAGCTRYRAGA